MNPDLIRSVLLQFEDDGKFPAPFIPTGVPTEELPGLLENLEQVCLFFTRRAAGRRASSFSR